MTMAVVATRRARRRRWNVLASGLLAYMFSATPAAISFVYCLGSDGHAGFEIVTGSSIGCEDCCHRPSPGHDGEHAQHQECVDVVMADQAPTVAKKHECSREDGMGIAMPDLGAGACLVPAPAWSSDAQATAQPPPAPLHRRTIVLQI
ncbi:MAG TPA: hypothetical protein VEC57_11110 [Candidatus Limnocylindrales bacterium]|nr:hypothetical protein [Candidatus Limnocylindrales bacterium]